ncbi:hypothetical protein RGE_31740 [Rubrivivax gelatinosus IL144]|uniref:Uncharacterized protein n=1 Tax=Rubrivivax gelatinosus (strain NBRC 100245 / IL144) TaxID=983917 RepID=I0HU26_RUBGI|nr:hypothetical protein RGE_31740 [Rubrivivax gelatinosus IL144]
MGPPLSTLMTGTRSAMTDETRRPAVGVVAGFRPAVEQASPARAGPARWT